MTTAEIVASLIAALSFVVSCVTAYKTLLARFSGKCGVSTRLILTHVDQTPSIGLACFFDNTGARPGVLDDLRLAVTHRQSGAKYLFFPQLMRNDYSIYASYELQDWFPFSGISLSAQERIERYVLFKPLYDRFIAAEGHYEARLEVRWYKSDKWQPIVPGLP